MRRRELTDRGRGLALVAIAVSMSTATAFAADAPGPDHRVTVTGDRSEAVDYGERVEVAGALRPASPGKAVQLEHAAAGAAFRAIARERTGRDGSYSFRSRPRRSGSYRVTARGAAASAAKRVAVVASITGRVTRHVLGGRAVRARGRLLPARRGRTVRLEQRAHGRWRGVDRVKTRRFGHFRTTWKPGAIGTHRLRVRFAGDRHAEAAGDRLAKVNSYRAGPASWYGPGLYGNHLGCGGTLTLGTLGVAHKSLPCGTRVTLRYNGRTATVPVVDRGPYAAGREWDLTAATKRRLGFGSTGTVWSTR